MMPSAASFESHALVFGGSVDRKKILKISNISGIGENWKNFK